VATRNSRFSHADLPVHGFAVASNKRNIEFHALFPEIDEGDYLIDGEHVARTYLRGLCSSLLHRLRMCTAKRYPGTRQDLRL
jgi:hypothetical protein